MKTTAKTAILAKLFALLLVVLSIIALLCTMPRASASADFMDPDLPEDPIDPPHECTSLCYTNIYYISDAPISSSYLNWFLNDIVDDYAFRHSVFNGFYYMDMNDESSYSAFMSEVGGFSQIENSLIIYEQRERFYKQVVWSSNITSSWQIEKLEDLFSMWKAARCKIMYICGTDEELFSDNYNNEFLRYVDFHVNIDLFTYFIDTFFQIYSEYDCSHTIILDKSLSINCLNGSAHREIQGNAEYYDTSDFCGYVLPMFLRTMFNIKLADAATTSDLLDLLDLNVLCYLDGHTFYDMRREVNYTYTYPEEFFDMYDSDRYCCISTTWWYDNYCDLGWMLSEFGEYGRAIDTYLFIDHGCYDTDNASGLYPFEYKFGLDRFEMADYLMRRMRAFIMGKDLSVYDNWPGRCVVTSKPINFGGGWVRANWSETVKRMYDVVILEDEIEKYMEF